MKKGNQAKLDLEKKLEKLTQEKEELESQVRDDLEEVGK
jgi:cell division protein FtsB